MLGKKKFVSVVAMASCMGAVFAAGSAVAAVPGRAGSLRVQPGVTGSRSVSSSSVATPKVSSEPSRMATLAGMSNLGAKPKLPSGASAAAVADLQDRLNELTADIDALRNAGVDEGAVRDILDSELANKNYATVPYVDDADSAKLAKDEFESKFDTRVDEKKLVDETKLAAETYTKGQVDDKVAGIKPTARIKYENEELKYENPDGTWTKFAQRSDFAGADGKNIELKKTDTEIQWKTAGTPDSAWTKLVGLDEIKGADGSVDAAQLERIVNEKIIEKDLPSKDFLSGHYVKQETYTADKETMNGQITAAQSAAENAGTAAASADSKADAALAAAQNAQSSANEKLTKEQADAYYAGKDFSYSKADVDTKIANAASGFDETRVSELITQAVDGAGFAKESDLTALDARVGTNETNITGLESNKADKSDLDEYAKKSKVLSNEGTFSISDGKIVYTDAESGVVKDIVSLNDITGPAGNDGNDGADACEPQYKGTENADGDTDVVITCKEDSSKILGRYTVKRGVNPCPGGIRLEPVSTNNDVTTYNLICDDGQ